MLKIMPLVYYAFAVVLVGGGAMGSRVSGKSSSLLGSAAFGAVAVFAGYLASRPNAQTGLIVGLVDALAVGAFFVYRYSVTGKPMPAFPSIALALIVAGLTLAALLNPGNRDATNALRGFSRPESGDTGSSV